MKAVKKVAGKFVTVPDGPYTGVYELRTIYTQVATPERDEILKCPCCAEPMHAAFDVCQTGFWQDDYETYFVCVACVSAVLFKYSFSRIEADAPAAV